MRKELVVTSRVCILVTEKCWYGDVNNVRSLTCFIKNFDDSFQRKLAELVHTLTKRVHDCSSPDTCIGH